MPKKINWEIAILFVLFFFFPSFCKNLQASSTQIKEQVQSFEEEILRRKQAEKEEYKMEVSSDDVSMPTHDQKIDFSKPLALEEILDIALRNNPTTRQAWYNAQSALAQRKQAQSEWFPQVSVSGEVNRERVFSDQPADKSSLVHYGPAVNMTYLLFDFGARESSIKEASELFLAQDFLYNQAVQDLILEVEKAYYELHTAKSAKKAAEIDVDTSKQVLDAAKLRLEAGVTTKLDVLQAQSDYNYSLYVLEQAIGDVDNAKAYLAQAMAMPADTEFDIVEPSREIPVEVIEQNVSQIIEEAMDKRPDLASADANLRAKEAAIKAAKSDLLPTLTLGGSAARNWYDYRKSRIPSKNHDYDYTAYVSVNWDIFDGFNNINKVNQAKAERDAAAQSLTQVELQVSVDVLTKFTAFKTAVKKLKYSEMIVGSTKASYELSFESYKAGLKDILDLIQAQDQYSEARSRLIQSKQDVFIALAELTHATGTLEANEEQKLSHSK